MNMIKQRLERFVRYTIFRLGIRKSIPAKIINSVPIIESNETMVNIKNADFIKLSPDLNERDAVFVRMHVYEMLKKASTMVPVNYCLKIYSAYRPRAEQYELWNMKYNEMRAKYPMMSEDELVAKTKRLCADPRGGFGGHQTGGAVDITLCDKDGNDVDMGGIIKKSFDNNMTDVSHPLWAGGVNSRTKSSNISEEARRNRKMLLNIMTAAGFINYPNEWWHYCYGDRMWAAYSNSRYAIYGEYVVEN